MPEYQPYIGEAPQRSVEAESKEEAEEKVKQMYGVHFSQITSIERVRD